MRRWTVRLLSLLLCLALVPLTGCQSSGTAYSEARSGVVRVLAYFECMEGLLEGYSEVGVGSSFGVGEAGEETDVFVTNRHVVADYVTDVDIPYQGEVVTVEDVPMTLVRAYLLLDDNAFSQATGLDTSRATPCQVLYQADEDEPDLAVLRSAEPVAGRVALTLGQEPEAGERVYALGYPVSADWASTDQTGVSYAAGVDSVTITEGIVSRIMDISTQNARFIQHTASINGGNSGGPLVDEKGAVVGVNTISFSLTGLDSGEQIHYGSVEVEHVKTVLDDLKISYDEGTNGSIIWYSILIGALVLVLAAVAAILVIRRRRRGKQAPVPPVAGGMQTPPAPAAAGDSGFRFQGVSGAFAGKRFSIAGTVRIGRDPARCSVVYPADTQGVSGVHCMLTVQNGAVCLMDLGSTYGTFLDGRRLAANQPVTLKPGDRFCLGSERECFVIARKEGL